MPAAFRIFHSTAFDRSLKRLIKKNADVLEIFESLIPILETDPMNTSLRHHIKKLEGVAQGDGQWRIRSGVYRLRYDVVGDQVHLHSINHRREAY
jgi:mRNA-degrading endonuclease RelE of RelBE toxin-antitoxin system